MNRREFFALIRIGALAACSAMVGSSLFEHKEERQELSDVIYETAIVRKEGNKPAYSFDDPYANRFKPKEHVVSFQGMNVLLKVDDEKLDKQFLEGEKVNLSYRQVYKAIYQHNNLFRKELTGYRFVSAEKER